MPLMKMNRNWTVRTTAGHTISFTAGEPIQVPDDYKVIEECQRFGAEYASEEEKAKVALPTDSIVTRAPRTMEERRNRINELLTEMRDNQTAHRSHFTAAGRPNLKYLNATLGFDVSGPEIEDMWKNLLYPTIEG